MLKKGLKFKLVASFLLAGLLPALSIGLYSLKQSSDSLHSAAEDNLQAVKEAKKQSINLYFNIIRSQVLTFAHDVSVIDATAAFKTAFDSYTDELQTSPEKLSFYKEKLREFYRNEYGQKYTRENKAPIDTDYLLNGLGSTELALQYHYIAGNKSPLGEKHELTDTKIEASYTKAHKKYHPAFREYLEEFAYYDIFLVDIETGHIVYSVFKELDYATSLQDGPYSQTNFARAFQEAKQLTSKEDVVLVDFEQYVPSYSAPASFIAAPIWDGDKKLGVAIFQMPLSEINGIMSQRAGMGETGESYLVGYDQLLRSDTHLSPNEWNSTMAFRKKEDHRISHESITRGLRGESGVVTTENYLNQSVVSAFSPITVLGLNWVIVSEISEAEAFAAANRIEMSIYLLTGIAALLLFVYSVWFSSSIVRRFQSIAEKLTEGATKLRTSSETMTGGAEQLSVTSDQTSDLVRETSATMQEMTSMVGKTTEHSEGCRELATKTIQSTEEGKQSVEMMSESMQSIEQSNRDLDEILVAIDKIVGKTKIVNDIVFKTQLLSFNAAIEAARAGEHGKGFAVVSEEIGKLAQLSGTAADEIAVLTDESKKIVSSSIEQIRHKVSTGSTVTGETVSSFNTIYNNIEALSQMVAEISAANKEQEIGIKQTSDTIARLDESSQQLKSVAGETKSTSGGLKTLSYDLVEIIDTLMATVIGGEESSSSNVISWKKDSDSLESNTDEKAA